MNLITALFSVAYIVVTVATVLLVVIQKPKGGGVSSLFGGGIADAAQSSSVAGRNLHRGTLGLLIVWFALLIASAVIASSAIG